MKEKLTVSCEGKPCYDIVLTIGFEELAGAALSVSAPERKICIVTDTNVALLYAAQVKEAFSSAFAQVEVFEFPAGEENKTLANIQTLYAFLIEHHFDRKDMLAALGGGVESGRLAGLDLPHLLGPALVIFAVIRNAKRWRAGAVPVGKEQGERTERGFQRQGWREFPTLGPEKPVVGA